MDLGEDRSSHNHVEYDYVTQGDYGCLPDWSNVVTHAYTGIETIDQTIRIGNCAVSPGAIEMTLKTADILGIYVSTQTGYTAHSSTGVYINGELYSHITDGPLPGGDCKYYEIPLDTNSLGAEFDLVINDSNSILYNPARDEQCFGNLQIAYVETRSSTGEGCVVTEKGTVCLCLLFDFSRNSIVDTISGWYEWYCTLCNTHRTMWFYGFRRR